MILKKSEIITEDCMQVVKNQETNLELLKNSSILITGGTGFMGTWIFELISFLNENYNFNTHQYLLSRKPLNFYEKVTNLKNRSDVTLIEKDIRSLVDIPNDVQWIIHAAASPDSRMHASEPLKVIDTIVNGTNCLLDCASRLPDLKRIINISSGNIYGSHIGDVYGTSEEDYGALDSSLFNSAYPESKRVAETICSVYRNQHRLPIINIRPFAFIGPYQALDRPWAINNFIRDGFFGDSIRILGDGKTVRSYMYPSDMAWWILNILTRGKTGLNYNVGSPESITLLDLAEKISSNFPKRPQIIKGLSYDKNSRNSTFVPNVDLVYKSLGLSITIDLDTAIKRTILWNQGVVI